MPNQLLNELLEEIEAGGYIGAGGRLINDPAFVKLKEIVGDLRPTPKLPQPKKVGTPKTKGKIK